MDQSTRIPFSRLLTTSKQNPLPISNLGSQIKTGLDLYHDVIGLCQQIQGMSKHRWGLYFEDSYTFLVSLLAIMHAGKIPIILPNLQIDFIESIKSQLEIIISDQESIKSTINFFNYENVDVNKKDELIISDLVSHESILELYTSGSTGGPQRFLKKTCSV